MERNLKKPLVKTLTNAWKSGEKSLERNLSKKSLQNLKNWVKSLEKIFEKKMEEAFNGDSKKGKKQYNNLFEDASYNTIKTIKIKMPKKAKLKLNVRHGELKMSSVLENAKGHISHGKFIANHINGDETSINVSYAKVDVANWISGQLKLKYVDDARIDNAENLILNAVSSDIEINNLSGTSVVNGSFGDLLINNISNTFNNLNIVLENSDARLNLPNTDYNLFYNGSKSSFNSERTSSKTIKKLPK